MEQNTLLEKEKAALDPSLHAKNSAASSTSAQGAVPNLNICAGGGSDDEPAPPAAPYGAEAGLPWWMLEA